MVSMEPVALYVASERIDLTRRANNQVFLIPVDGIEAVNGVALNVFAANGGQELFGGRGYEVFSTVFLGIISDSADFISF